jgi:hypothetical protein
MLQRFDRDRILSIAWSYYIKSRTKRQSEQISLSKEMAISVKDADLLCPNERSL